MITQKHRNRKFSKKKYSRNSSLNKADLRRKARHHARVEKQKQPRLTKGFDEKALVEIARSIWGHCLHHKQILSISLVTLGVIHTARMTIHAIGGAIVKARRWGCTKHGIKQVDRFMSNKKIKPVVLREALVQAVIGNRKDVCMTMDWTDFDKDDQTTLAISLVMRHGRAIPLVWTNVRKSTLKGKRAGYERTAVQMLREALPKGVHVTLMADRGFGDTKLFDHLAGIPGFDFIVRFRKDYAIITEEFQGKAKTAVYKNGRIRVFQNALLTGNRRGPYTVVLYKAQKMKDSWCLASSLNTSDGWNIVSKYSRRFECEESFRDLKDWRYGMALKHTHIKSSLRREKLLFVFALTAYLLTLVGLVSEELGIDRLLKANTCKQRTHSLLRQGREIVAGALPDDCRRKTWNLINEKLQIALNQGFYNAMA